MTIKVNDRSLDFVGMIFWAACCLYLVQCLMGCTLHIGVDWHGETAKDDKTFTQAKK